MRSRARRSARRPARASGRSHRGPRRRDALPLAAGELVGVLRQHLFYAERAGGLAHALLDLARRHLLDGQRQGYVLERRERVQQVRVLERRSPSSRLNFARAPPGKAGHLPAAHHDLSRRGRIDGGKAVEQRGLSRPARPHESQELSRAHGKAHMVERQRHVAFGTPPPLVAIALDHARAPPRPQRAPPSSPSCPCSCSHLPFRDVPSVGRTDALLQATLQPACPSLRLPYEGRPARTRRARLCFNEAWRSDATGACSRRQAGFAEGREETGTWQAVSA